MNIHVGRMMSTHRSFTSGLGGDDVADLAEDSDDEDESDGGGGYDSLENGDEDRDANDSDAEDPQLSRLNVSGSNSAGLHLILLVHQ